MGEGCPPPPPGAERRHGRRAARPRGPGPPARVLACVGSWPISGSHVQPLGDRGPQEHAGQCSPRQQARHSEGSAQAGEVDHDRGDGLPDQRRLGAGGSPNSSASNASASKVLPDVRPHPPRAVPRVPGNFAKFLKSSGQTVGDLLFRVRLLTSIRRRSRSGYWKARAAKAPLDHSSLGEFVKSFRAKWRPQTYCVSTFAVPGLRRRARSLLGRPGGLTIRRRRLRPPAGGAAAQLTIVPAADDDLPHRRARGSGPRAGR